MTSQSMAGANAPAMYFYRIFHLPDELPHGNAT